MSISPPGQQYTWLPINEGEIRILELQPGAYGDQLCGYLSRAQLPTPSEVSTPSEAAEPPEVSAISEEADGSELQLDSTITAGKSRANPHYEAISYSWDSVQKPYTLIVEGESCLPIPASLHHALRRFRYSDKTRYLWADAICINQDDLDEKAIQVAAMGNIFRSAAQVLIWLGESNGLDWLAFSLLDAMYLWNDEIGLSEQQVGTAVLICKHCCTCCRRIEHATWQQAYGAALRSLNDILKRSWFKRLWVFQEATVASFAEIHSGEHATPLDSLAGFVNWYSYGSASSAAKIQRPTDSELINEHLDLSLLSIADDTTAGSRVALHEPKGQADFMAALADTWYRECREPLDRIYAIRSITRLRTWSGTEPNYRRDPIDLFGQITFLSLLESNEPSAEVLLAMAPLTHASVGHDSTVSWPSWIPDFHHLTRRCNLKWIHYYEPSARIRPGHARPSHMMTYQRPKISMPGYVVGRVFRVLPRSQLSRVHGCVFRTEGRGGQILNRTDDQAAFLAWILRCSNFIRGHADACDKREKHSVEHPMQVRDLKDLTYLFKNNEYPTAPHKRNDDRIATDIAISYHKIYRSHLELSDVALLVELLREFVKSRWTEAAVKILHMLSTPGGVLQLIEPETCLAALETSSDVVFGWVPENAQADDEVCSIGDGPHPFIVRKRDQESDSYQLIGDAYFDKFRETAIARPASMESSIITLE